MVNGFSRRERNLINYVIGTSEAFNVEDDAEGIARSLPAINFAESQGLDLTGAQIAALVRRAGLQKVTVSRPAFAEPRRVRRARLRIDGGRDALDFTRPEFSRKIGKCNTEVGGISIFRRALSNLEHIALTALEGGPDTIKFLTSEYRSFFLQLKDDAVTLKEEGVLSNTEIDRAMENTNNTWRIMDKWDDNPHDENMAAELARSIPALQKDLANAEQNWALQFTECLMADEETQNLILLAKLRGDR